MKIKTFTTDVINQISGINWPANDDTLDVSDHEISPENLTLVLEAVNQNSHIKHLNLCGCLTEQTNEIATIARFLKTNQILQSLDLSENELDSTLVAALFTALKENKSLKHLNLKYNLIGDGVAEHEIVNFIKNTFSLESLDISHNGIQNATAAAMAKALEKNKTLLSLDISGNLMSETGVQFLSNSLIEKNQTLIALCAAEQYDPSHPYKITTHHQVQKIIDCHTNRNQTLRAKTIDKSERITKSTPKQDMVTQEPIEFEINLAKKVKRLFNYVFANKT